MNESLHDALDAIAFLLAVIAAAALADLAIRYGPGGLLYAVLFLVVLTLVGGALGVIPDRDGPVETGSGSGGESS